MYQERENFGNGYRIKYLHGLETLVQRRRAEAKDNRVRFLKDISENREAYAGDEKDHFRFHVFQGEHEFCPRGDSPIDWVLEHL